MEEIINDILKKVSTESDLIFFLEEINKLKEIIFQETNQSLTKKAKSKIGQELFSLIEKWEREKKIPSSSKKQFSFFEKIQKQLNKIPIIRITIPFVPSNGFLLKINEKINKLSQRKNILDININPQIIGGVIIEYRGKYFDDSILKKIKEERIIEKVLSL